MLSDTEVPVPKFRVYPGSQRFPHGKPLAEDSYFVLRSTDLLAPAVMWGYVHEIQTLLELDRSRPFLTADERLYLEDLENEVQTRAELWQREGKGRLPD